MENIGATTIDELCQVSSMLNTGLNREQLIAALECIDLGANPVALAELVRSVRSNRTK